MSHMLPQAEVEVVLIHWKRPDNIMPILSALRQQSVPCQITLIDASPADFPLPPKAPSLADTFYRFYQNRGSFNRFIPAFGYELPYTYFHDDDMLPGTRVIEHFLRHARGCHDRFAVLGQSGRLLQERDSYNVPLNPPRDPSVLMPIDSVIRGYFVKTERLLHMLQFKQKLGLVGITHCDDLLLSTSIQYYTQFPSYVTPIGSGDPEERMNKEELPEPFADWHDPIHLPARNEYMNKAYHAGWRSLTYFLESTQANKAP